MAWSNFYSLFGWLKILQRMTCKYNVNFCANIFPQNMWETWTLHDHASWWHSLNSLNWEPKKYKFKELWQISFTSYVSLGDISSSLTGISIEIHGQISLNCQSGWCPMNTWEDTCMADAEKNHCLYHFWSLEIPLLCPEQLCQSWCPDESPVWIITSCLPKFPIWSIFQSLP